jgi:hypothetical protein
MPERVDLFDSRYSHFTEHVLDIARIAYLVEAE